MSCSVVFLTLKKIKGKLSTFYLSKETLNRSNFNTLKKDSIINIEENEQYKQVLKDNIYMYNHHTSYGIILIIGICSMAYLSQQKKIVN